MISKEEKLEGINIAYKLILEEESRIKDNLSKIENDKNVKWYLDLLKQEKFCKQKKEELEVELESSKMDDCLHMFICTSPATELGNRNVYHCLRCGLTNLYNEKIIDEPLSLLQKKMKNIYNDSSMHGMKLKIFSSDIEFYKKELEELEELNPYITDIKLGLYLEQIYRDKKENGKAFSLKR